MQNENQSPEQVQKLLMIIWIAIFISQFMFLVIVFYVKPEVFKFDFEQPFFDENAPLVIMFALLAVSNLIISFILNKKYISEAVLNQNINAVQTGMIVGCALCESISLFGFVLAFAFDYQYFFLWFVLGILGMFLHFPRRDYIQNASFKRLQKS